MYNNQIPRAQDRNSLRKFYNEFRDVIDLNYVFDIPRNGNSLWHSSKVCVVLVLKYKIEKEDMFEGAYPFKTFTNLILNIILNM